MAGKERRTKRAARRGIWRRTGRANYFAWVNGRQVDLGTDDEKAALVKWHELAGTDAGAEANAEQADGLRVENLLDDFLDHLHASRNRAYGWYRTRLRSFRASIPKGLTLAALRPKHVTRWLAANPDWSPTYAASCAGAVQRAMNFHVEEGTLAAPPLPKLRKPERKRREFCYTPEQLATLLVGAHGAARVFLGLVAATGCRPSELAAARGGDVDPDGATIAVPKPKNKRPRRMPVPVSLRALVRRLADAAGVGPLLLQDRREQPKKKVKRAAGTGGGKQEQGGPWHRMAWSRALRDAKARAKRWGLALPAGADVYAMRHTWVTEALTAGISVSDTAAACGTSIAMLSKVYAHVLTGQSRSVADRL